MLDKSLFICYSTPNYSKITSLFLNSLNDINANNIKHMLDDTTTKTFKKTGFQSELWYYCLRTKLNHLIDVLKTSDCYNNIKYFISTDCDVIYIKNNVHEWYNLENYMESENKDIYFMREHITDGVNGGFFIIKNNANITSIINFLIEVLEVFDNTDRVDMPFGEQSIINYLKYKINYGYIPNAYVIWGTIVYNKNKSLFHHAVATRDVNDKIKQINSIQILFK